MKKLLIVDDAAFMRMSIKNMLQNSDVEIVGEASNGIEAIEQYQKLQPDIITMDITMPIKDGIEALEEIRKLDKAVKVVMVTAMGNQELVTKAIILGATSFIVKPFEKDKLLEVIRAII